MSPWASSRTRRHRSNEFLSYVSQIKNLLLRHGIHNVDDLKRAAKDPSFKCEVTALWEDILKSEGRKLTGTLVSSTIALALGGVGIATGGSAIGLPLLGNLGSCRIHRWSGA